MMRTGRSGRSVARRDKVIVSWLRRGGRQVGRGRRVQLNRADGGGVAKGRARLERRVGR